MEGLGESFQPSLNTGTAKYRIALSLPAGTSGTAPSLSLSYEGGGGNGPLGFGWRLPTAFVQRQTDKGIPRYPGSGVNSGHDAGEADTFINEMKEELVPVSSGHYFCKNEGAFIRYRFIGPHWEGTTPEGTLIEFGLSSEARLQDEAGKRTFSWLVERVTDVHGNSIRYHYRSFPGLENLNQKYLVRIEYGPSKPPWSNFHFATLQYTNRSDWFEDCRSGFPIRTGMRLQEIVIGTQGPMLAGHLQGDFNQDGVPDNLVRKYRLDYAAYDSRDPHWSYLAAVTPVGADGVSSLPPSRFDYSICNPPASVSASTNIISGLNEPFPVMDNPLVDLVDLNGDGLPDLLKTEQGGGSHFAYLNRGQTNLPSGPAIQWSVRTEMTSEDGRALLINLETEDQVAHLADLDGDGMADLVFKPASDSVYFFRNLGRQAWGARISMAENEETPPAPFGRGAESLNVKTADVNFDKRIDILQSVGFGYRVWSNVGGRKYSSPVTVPHPAPFNLSDPGVEITDLNGDRVPDVVQIRPQSILVQTGYGHGDFSEAVTVSLPESNLDAQQLARARLQDLTGDGLPEFVVPQAEPGVLWYWINRGNYAFNAKKIITDIPRLIGIDTATRWVDLNGNGTTDYILANSEATPRIQAVDLATVIQCVSGPNLLSRIDNGIGRITEIDYLPSTTFALDDAASGAPWPDPMPFPVSVVSRVRTSDSLGHFYVTEFRYHDGYYDGVEKEFRGFARAEQVDLGDPTAPTLITRSHFDTGREFEAMKGKILRLTAEQEDGLAFTDESTDWVNPPLTLYQGTNGHAVSFAHPTGVVKLVKELGLGTERRLETESKYDGFGNVTWHADYGIVEAEDRSAFDDERIVTTEYAINTERWLIREPKRIELSDEKGNVLSRTEFFYDDETFAGQNQGLITIGNLTLKREWKDPSQPEAFITAARTKYDSFGNPTTLLDPLATASGGVVDWKRGHAREIDYDSRFHTYPVTETIHIGDGKTPLLFEAAYNEGFGTVTSSTDFNGNTTSYLYDSFARLTSIVRPGDTVAYPTAEYDYALSVPFGISNLVNYVETRMLDKTPGSAGDRRSHYFISRDFVDGLGRKLLSKQEATETPDTVRVSVKGAVRFNARQKPFTALNPFYSTLAGNLDAQLAYESIEALGWSGLFTSSNSLVTLSLASAHQSSTAYDATLRELTVVNPDGTSRRTVYEPLLTRSFDENDNDPASPNFDTPMVHHNDGLGHLIRVDEMTRINDDGTPAGALKTWTTAYQYDLNDQLTRITDSQNNVKLMSYDGLKRKTFMNDPDRGVMNFLFDDAANLAESTDAKGQRITYTYDGANRILTEDYHDEGQPFSFKFVFNPLIPVSATNRPDVAYFYDVPQASLDAGDGSVATASNTKGKLAYVWDLSGEEHTSYDARDRVGYVVKRVRDPLHGQLVSYRTGFAYDSLDRLTALTYPDNDAIGYRYNDRNLLSRIIGGPTGSIISNLVYLPSHQQREILYGNGIRTDYAYDSRLRLNSLLTRCLPSPGGEGQGEGELINFSYDFDGASNIKSIRDDRPGSAVPAGDKRRNTQLFLYDDLYRLTRAQYSFALPGDPPTNNGEVNYRYDRIGNMLEQKSTITDRDPNTGLPVANLGVMNSGGPAGRFNRTGRTASDPPGPHALTSIQSPSAGTRSFPYDANGNMTDLEGMEATWDFKDRLVALENKSMRADYAYDFTDRRVVKRVAMKSAPSAEAVPRVTYPFTTIYVGKHFEVREFDTPTKFVFNGDTRVARVTGTLSPNQRVQRLPVSAGWNLVSVALISEGGGAQLSEGGKVEAIYKWSRETRSFAAVSPTDTIPAGSVLWIKALSGATLRVVGTYPGPVPNMRGPPGGDFLPAFGLECWPTSTLGSQPSTTLWRFAPDIQKWQTKLPSPLESFSDLPPALAPHEAIFVQAPLPLDLAVPDPALSIRFYHQDHLGSSSVMTDAAGALVEESANFPFGGPRSEFRPRGRREEYQFTQKERDGESGLQYFEKRFLGSAFARFVSVDPYSQQPPDTFLRDPQQFNSYSYTRNNPFTHLDPDGRGLISILAKVGKAVLKGEEIYSTVSGIVEDAQTIQNAPSGFSPEAILAGISIATEILPVSVGDIESAWRWANRAGDAKDLKQHSRSVGSVGDAAKKGGIYEFPDQKAGGTPYVGQSGDLASRLKTHESKGRLKPGTETTTGVAGDKTAREIAEHKRIQEITGGVPASKSDAVSNKVDPIGPKRQHLLDEE